MNKKNAIYNDFIAALMPDDNINITYEYGEQNFNVNVRRNLTIDEKGIFIDRVVNSCFDETDSFHPEYKDAIFQITLLQMLTDIPVFSVKKDELNDDGSLTGKKIDIIDIDKTYNLCRCLNLFDKVQDEIFKSLCVELKMLINEKLAYKQQQILMGERKQLERTRSEFDSGLALIGSIADKLNETMGSTFGDKNVFQMTDEFTERMKNMTNEELVSSIINSH